MIQREIFHFLLLTLLFAQRIDAATVLTNARIIDGTGKAPLESGAIAFDGDRITAIGTADQIQIPQGAQVLNAQGKTCVASVERVPAQRYR